MERRAVVEVLETEPTEIQEVAFGTGVRFREGNGEGILATATGRDYALSETAVQQLAKMCRIPKEYALRCPPHLLVPQLNWWTQGARETARLVISNDKVITLANPHDIWCPTQYLLDGVEKGMGEVIDYEHFSHSLEYTSLALLGEKQTEVVRGDIINGGIRLEHSLLGVYPTAITGFVNRLVCTNGAVSSEIVSKWSQKQTGGVPDIVRWAEEIAAEAWARIDGYMEKVKALVDVRLNGFTSHTLNDILDTYHIPGEVRDAIIDRVVDEGAHNLYDIFNAITYVASHDVEDPRAAGRLMLIGGNLADNQEICPHCHRVM